MGFMTAIDKAHVLEALRARIADTLGSLTDSQKATQAGAVHEETRAEDPKDTRATEASYLARGLARRVAELKLGAARLGSLVPMAFGPEDSVALTALAGLEDEDGGASIVFLVPAGAGETVEVDGQAIRPITPGSPLGKALLGRFPGDEVEVELPGGVQLFRISWIT